MIPCAKLETAIELCAEIAANKQDCVLGVQWNRSRQRFVFAVFKDDDELIEEGYTAVGENSLLMFIRLMTEARPAPETEVEFADPMVKT